MRRLPCIPTRTADLDAQGAFEQGVGAVKGSIAAPAAPAAAAAPAPAMDEEGMAVVMAAVCEETGLPIDQIRIKNVQELK